MPTFWGNVLKPGEKPASQSVYANAVQAFMDAKAQERGYDSIASATSYRGDANPRYDSEAQALFTWRSNVWTYANEELRKVIAQQREQPTVQDFLNELPQFSWPTSE